MRTTGVVTLVALAFVSGARAQVFQPLPQGAMWTGLSPGSYDLGKVLGERAFGAGSPALHRKAIALARLANVQLLRLGFDGAGEDARLLNADQFPLLDDPDVEAAVLTALARR